MMKKKFSERDLSKKIDKLNYSVKPDNYSRFKEKLLKRLIHRLTPTSPTYYEAVYVSTERELEKRNIKVYPELLSKCVIMGISLMGCLREEFEYELTKDDMDYMNIILEPMCR